VWSLEDKEFNIKTLSEHSNYVSSVAITNDRTMIISASYDKTIKVWNYDTGEEIKTLIGHSECIFSIAISKDGVKIVSGSKDKTIRV